MKWIRYFLLLFFCIFGLLILFIESNPGKKYLEKKIIENLQSEAFSIQAEFTTSNLPESIDFQNVQIIQKNHLILIENLHLEFSILNLLKKEFFIKNLKAKNIQIDGFETNETSFPLDITIHTFKLENLRWKNTPAIDLVGSAQFGKNGSIQLQFQSSLKENKETTLSATFQKFQNLPLHAKLDLKTPSIQQISPWIETNYDYPLDIHLELTGTPLVFTGQMDGISEIAQEKWEFQSKIEKKPDHIQLLDFVAVSPTKKIEGMVNINQFVNFDLNIQFELSPYHPNIGGTIFAFVKAEQTEDGFQTNVSWHSPVLTIDSYRIEKAFGEMSGWINANQANGNGSVHGNFLNENWSLTTSFSTNLQNEIQLDALEINSALAIAKGQISYSSDQMWIGYLDISKGDLQIIHRLHPKWKSFGEFEGECIFSAIEDSQTRKQEFTFDFTGKNIAFENFLIENLALEGNFFEKTVHFDLKNGKFRKLQIDNASGTYSQSQFWASSNGVLRNPFNVEISGILKETMAQIDQLNGTFLSHYMSLSRPTIISWENQTFIWKDCLFNLGIGQIALNLSLSSKKTSIDIKTNQFPLDIFSLNPLDLDAAGALTSELNFIQDETISSGHLRSNFELAIQNTFLSGICNANYQNEQLNFQSNIESNGKPFLTADFNLPLEIQAFDSQFSIPPLGQMKGSFFCQGQLGEMLDFFDLGTHHIDGIVLCDLKVSNTFSNPSVEGFFEISDGIYQNYLTGTELTHLRAEIIAQNDHLLLRSFTAQDLKKSGTLKATGKLLLDPYSFFPFDSKIEFTNLDLVQIDLISTISQGNLEIKGNTQGATASGNLELVQTQISIPDSIPKPLPELQVVYKNAPAPTPEAPSFFATYPIFLNLQINVPNQLFIDGRGLSSEWKANFLVTGTFLMPKAEGKIKLINGEFNFSGRIFKLTKGELLLVGKQYEMPILNIEASLQEKGILITARLKGPINQPQLTFQSTPPLPMSSIISYLLFGKDLSEINGFEAITVATAIASLSGQSSSVLESTRKSLGIDRLSIVTLPGKGESEGGLAIQIGKVIAPGVIVTITQGAADPSPNISIEVDLKRGFVFEAESAQQQEQGRFSLKWNKNY